MTMTAPPGSETAQAEAALVDLAEAEAIASRAVDAARDEMASGRAKLGDVLRAQRVLSKAQEAFAQGQARLRVVIRGDEATREADRAARENARALKARELSAERDELQARIATFFAQLEANAVFLDHLAADWNNRAAGARKEGGGAQPGHLTRPSDLGMAWGRFMDGAQLMRREFPVQKART
jgi:hypothetical protein